MKILISLSLLILIASTASAENPQKEIIKEKHVIISTDNAKPHKSISEIMTWVDSQTGGEDGENNIEVFVTVDHDGELKMGKNEGNHKIHKMISGSSMMPHRFGFAEGHSLRAARTKMGADAATCVLKNISKINSEGAARLLKQACISLNPSETKAEE